MRNKRGITKAEARSGWDKRTTNETRYERKYETKDEVRRDYNYKMDRRDYYSDASEVRLDG